MIEWLINVCWRESDWGRVCVCGGGGIGIEREGERGREGTDRESGRERKRG